jgi:hypothetical protein
MKYAKIITIVALGTVTGWLVVKWALPPGWWAGSILSGTEESAEQIARRCFGPLLLQQHCLHETGFATDLALAKWGEFETLYRLLAIIAMQFVMTSAAISMLRKGTPTRHCTLSAGAAEA